jgi:hypothetical protein
MGDLFGIGEETISDRRVKWKRSDDGDVSAGFEEEEQPARGHYPAADEEDGTVLEAESEEERGAVTDGRVGLADQREAFRRPWLPLHSPRQV